MRHVFFFICAFLCHIAAAAQDTDFPYEYVNRMADSCKTYYSQQSVSQFVEKYKGKEVWVIEQFDHGLNKLFWKTVKRNEPHNWLDSYGTSLYKSVGIGNGFEAKNCILSDFVLLPNKNEWMRIQDETGKWHTLSNGQRITMFKHNEFVHKREYQDYDPEYTPMFCYYAVFTINPEKTYKRHRDSITVATADTLFVEYSEKLHNYIYLNDEFLAVIKENEEKVKEVIEQQNIMERARYNYAKERWGERIAQKIRQGLVEFGFSPEMCVEARRNEPRHIEKIMTPLGLATQYDFYLEGLKLYFIEDKLVGIEEKGRQPRYHR